MTAQERQALWFLLALTLLGTGVRIVHSRRESGPADPAALAGQLAAVDSAIEGGGRSRRKSSKARGKAARPARGQSVDDPLESISAAPRASSGPSRLSATASPSSQPVDLDVATQGEIETLPWVGPALAERIVRSRDLCGPFGNIEALQRVPGVGSGIAERLSERVTFSGSARPLSTVPSQCDPHRTTTRFGTRNLRP